VTNIELVNERLKILEENLIELEKYQALSLEQLKLNKKNLWAAEHGLQISIESILDIGNHIIANDRLGNPASYREIIEILGQKEVLPSSFAKELYKMPGFRNILIHEYIRVNAAEVFGNLKKAPAQFKKFIGFISIYLHKIDTENE